MIPSLLTRDGDPRLVDHEGERPDDDGDAITAELTASRLLGGGSSYEAYLAPDDGHESGVEPVERFPQTGSAPYEVPAGVHPLIAETVPVILEPDPGARPEPREVAEALGTVLEALPRQRLAGFKVR